MEKLFNTELFGTFEYDSIILSIYSDNYNFYLKNKSLFVSLGSYNSMLYSIEKGIEHTTNNDIRELFTKEKINIINNMLKILEEIKGN